jgi:hypothetical protein
MATPAPDHVALTAARRDDSIFRTAALMYNISIPTLRGRVAQLGERLVRNEEVAGSIPVSSTTFRWLCSFSYAAALLFPIPNMQTA